MTPRPETIHASGSGPRRRSAGLARRGGHRPARRTGRPRRPILPGVPLLFAGLGLLAGAAGLGAQQAEPPGEAEDGGSTELFREVSADGPGGEAAVTGPVEPPPLPAGRDELVRIIDRPEEGAVEVVIGPVKLPAGAHLRTPVQLASLPIEGWLHGYEWWVTDGEGRPLPDRLLHHVNFLDPDARELFAPIPRRVLSAGRETGRQEMPHLLGYPIEGGTRLLIAPMFANPTERELEDVHLRVRLLYSPGDARLVRPARVYPFYLDVMGPVGPKHFEVPPGRSVVSWEGRPAIDGRILAIGGHLHDYGVRLRLVDVTSGEVIYEVEPEIDERGRVVRVPTARLWWKGGIPISKERTYRVEVVYENPLDRPAPGQGMGVLGGIVLAAPDAAWPALERRDPAYAEDLRNTLEEPFRDAGHGGHAGHGGAREAEEGAGAGSG